MKRLSVLFLAASLAIGSLHTPVLASGLGAGTVMMEQAENQGRITVSDMNAIQDRTAAMTAALPADFDAAYEVNLKGAEIDAANRVIRVPADAVPGTYTVTAKDRSGKYADVKADFTVSNYILVNIPYAEFYRADVRNDVEVDAFSSATRSKAANAGLAGNTYHKEDNSEITGVTFPVLTDSVEGLTAAESKEALATAESMSFAAVLTEKPSAYKVYEKGTFGTLQGTVNSVNNASVSITANSGYGDYQVDVEGILTNTDRQGNIISQGAVSKDAAVYGAIVSTATNDYGMRALENIWKAELAWCTGFTTSVHNCPTSSAHYAGMMGQNITAITYITSEGIYRADGLNLYVQKKSADTSVTVANAYLSEGAAVITEKYAKGFEPEYQVEDLEGAVVIDGKITFPETTEPGSYTLKVSDKSGVYADVIARFQVVSDILPASYDASQKTLVKSEKADEAQFEEYVNKITAVSVDGTSYSKNGMHGQAGTVIVMTEEGVLGKIDTTLDIFAEKKAYELSISVVGYDTLNFTVDLSEPVKQPVKQTLKTSAASYKKTYGDKKFALGAKTSGDGALSYKSSNTKVAVVSSKGIVTIKGAGTAKITVKAAATSAYKAASKTVTVTVAKAAQPMKVKISAKTCKASALKSKAATFSIGTSKAVGKVTYKTDSKYVKVSSKGVVTVKKGTKKGTYKVTVKAAGNTNYKSGSKTVKITVK